MNILIFFLILLVLVIVHEFGHFFSAKKFGIRVDEFGFGFPPKLFGVKKGETEYTFNALPFGGFVKIFGENPDEESTIGPDAARSFINKPKWQQAIVLFAGVFANFILAWFLFSFGFLSGLPTSVENSGRHEVKDASLMIIAVFPGSPAEEAGLKPGDKILGVKNGNNTLPEANPETVRTFVQESTGEVVINYARGEAIGEISVLPERSNTDAKPVIGISMDQVGVLKLPFFSAFAEGMRLTISVTKGTAVGLYTLIKDAIMGQGSFNSITGPVGMVGIVGDAYDLGFTYLLSFAALISINLAIINLIPFPALDGGRLLFLLIEKIKGSALNQKFANTANFVGFALLILLMLAVTYHDIVKLF